MNTRHDAAVLFIDRTYNAHSVAIQGEEAFIRNSIKQNTFTGTVETRTEKAKKLYALCVKECEAKGIEIEILPPKPPKEVPGAEGKQKPQRPNKGAGATPPFVPKK